VSATTTVTTWPGVAALREQFAEEAWRTAQKRQEVTGWTVEEARQAIDNAPLTPAWKVSVLSDVGRVRIATRILVERGWRPEQVVEALCSVALELVPHPSIPRPWRSGLQMPKG